MAVNGVLRQADEVLTDWGDRVGIDGRSTQNQKCSQVRQIARRIGTPEDDFGWLYSMWADQPASLFLAWEAIGHGYSHLGELTSIRNRMGLSPF